MIDSLPKPKMHTVATSAPKRVLHFQEHEPKYSTTSTMGRQVTGKSWNNWKRHEIAISKKQKTGATDIERRTNLQKVG